MGIIDWWKQRHREIEEVRRLAETIRPILDQRSRPAAPPRHSAMSRREPAPPPPPTRHAAGIAARWVPPGQPIQVHDVTITSGMIYVGNVLPTQKGGSDPALIDPSLGIDRRGLGSNAIELDYWPSYAALSPHSRAAYLGWLAEGRRSPAAAIGFVFLFLEGLERRVLLDLGANPALAGELPAIRSEVAALLELYAPLSASFRESGTQFLAVIDLMMTDLGEIDLTAPPPLENRREPVPIALRMGLGRLAAEHRPVPASWAHAWGWYLQTNPPRAALLRHPDLVARRFGQRYHAAFGDGIIVDPGSSTIALHYRPANSGIADGTLRSKTIPDVFRNPRAAQQIDQLLHEATNDLDDYTRWVGRNPGKAESLLALSQLPADFPIDTMGDAQRLLAWAKATLGTDDQAIVAGDDLLRFWFDVISSDTYAGAGVAITGAGGQTPHTHASAPARLSRGNSEAIAAVLGRLGFGIEPDVRFGGAAIAPTARFVLFREATGAPRQPRAAYTSATLLARLAMVVATADEQVGPAERNRLCDSIAASSNLTSAEATRLGAHISALTLSEIKLTGVKSRIAVLDSAQRAAIGDLLVAVAASDGIVAPAEVTTLMKLFRTLGLDRERVTSHLHAQMTAVPRPARKPVTMRPAGEPEPGFVIPPPPAAGAEISTPAAAPPPSAGFTLDQDAVRQKMADTAAVSALLGGIFADENETDVLQSKESGDAPVAATSAAGDAPAVVAGLDAAHAAVLRAVATQATWSAEAFASLTSTHDLLPNGALDVLNESALEIAGEPLLEGEDPITVNTYALAAMLA